MAPDSIMPPPVRQVGVQYVRPERWLQILVAYLVVGVLAGAGWAQGLAQSQLGRAGIGTALMVNGLMPLAAIVLAVIYPHRRFAMLGGLTLALGFVLATTFRAEPRVWLWTAAMFAAPPPVLVAATAGYVLIGLAGASLARVWRRVGRADEHLRCPACGYLQIGLDGRPCPECGGSGNSRPRVK